MTTTSCTITGALYPCLYPACSRVCISDEADYIHPCNNGNQGGYFRGCICGQILNTTALVPPWTEIQVHLFYDQVLACVSGTPGKCGQDEQQLFWDTHVSLCEEGGLPVPEGLKPAGFGRLQVNTSGSTLISTSTTSSTASSTTLTASKSPPSGSGSGSSIGTADIIGLTVSFVGLFIGIAFGLLVFTWRRNERGSLEMLWRNDESKIDWFWRRRFHSRPRSQVAESIPLR